MDKLKVVWICSFSNEEVRKYYSVKYSPLERLLLRAIGRSPEISVDSAIWNTNAIHEIEKRDDVDLHILSPIRNLSEKYVEFKLYGITYHYFRDEDSNAIRKVVRQLFTKNSSTFKKNRKEMRKIISDINPDIVHVMGAENPYYSLGLLEVPETTPTLLQLQALLGTNLNKVTGAGKKSFEYKSKIEKLLIKNSTFVGVCEDNFRNFIKSEIASDITMLNTDLAMAQSIKLTNDEKKFDFVHFSAKMSFSKASDVALKAFAKVHNQYPEVTLELIGGMNDDMKNFADSFIKEENLSDVVTIHGLQPTHDDVIKLMRKAKFALLPLKTSLVPNTLHEAMANGLPLLTTKTEGTPTLNEKRQSCLISEIGDVDGLAENMIKLLNNLDLAEELRQNAAITESEFANNKDIVSHWVEAYHAIIANKKHGIPIPQEFLA